MNHEKFIKRCFELAKLGIGNVSPNPMVGALIVRDNEIISEAYHQNFGGPHAEVNAIKNANLSDFSDCILYVNLEPCNHYGKTPPCTDLIIESKFKQVVIATEDPNPLVKGSGIKKLKDNGIEVISGICYDEAVYLNRFFFKNQIENTSFIITKVAQSLDGCIAMNNGESRWISNEKSRTYTHAIRSYVDAVMVGRKTIQKDNPHLTTRLVDGKNPKRIALDTNLSLPLDLDIFKNDDRANTFVICSVNSSTSRKADILKLGGIKIIPVETEDNGLLNLDDAFAKLYKDFDISSLLIEGGSTVHSYLAEKEYIDELHIFIAPKIIGDGMKSFKKLISKSIDLSKKYKLIELENFDGDIHAIFIKE